MNTGFGSLTQLKALVLPESLRAETTWDAQLTALGLGVVAMFERHCNRLFLRTAGDVYYHDAAARVLSVPRYPIETVTTVALKLALETSYTTQADIVANTDLGAGLIHLTQILGGAQDQIKVTYTGGLWWDTTEDASGTQPAGSTAVHADLIQAWAQQVQHQIEAADLLKLGSAKDKPATSGMEMLPLVKNILRPHTRFS